MGEQDGFKGLRVTNTLTGRKEDFVPLEPNDVRMYVCGPTVYDFAHIGNARPAIVFDVLFRLLRHLYGAEHVTYVRNITDVDDKIIHRAAEDYPDLPLNEAIGKVTAATEKQYHEDVAALGCLPPTVEPRATEHIVEMVAMIKALVDEGHSYPAEGHVLFDVKSWKAADGSLAYGKLSRRSLDDMIAGARVEVAPYKRDPMDFVLWKPSKPGEPAWPSPWGEGRPGWHIECSAMAKKHLGETFDIHGGGIDLVFPHHENEIAQSRVANHTERMARYWMHNGFLQVEGRKMAKSEGNFVTITDLIDTRVFGSSKWHGYVLRLAMLMTHYRQPIDWTVDRLVDARKMLRDWIDYCTAIDPDPTPPAELISALSEDLNSPRAISLLHELSRGGRASLDKHKARQLGAALRFLGLWQGEPSIEIYGYGYDASAGPSEADVQPLVDARSEARKAKDFAEADRIRDELDAMGIQLKDARDPKTGELVTTWEEKR